MTSDHITDYDNGSLYKDLHTKYLILFVIIFLKHEKIPNQIYLEINLNAKIYLKSQNKKSRKYNLTFSKSVTLSSIFFC